MHKQLDEVLASVVAEAVEDVKKNEEDEDKNCNKLCKRKVAFGHEGTNEDKKEGEDVDTGQS